MKVNQLKKRLQKNRPASTIRLKIPKDVLHDLQRIAPRLGFSHYEALIRAYIGQGLRADLERFEHSPELSELIDSLRRHGVDDAVLASAVAEARES